MVLTQLIKLLVMEYLRVVYQARFSLLLIYQKTTQSFELKLSLWTEHIVMIYISNFQDKCMSRFTSRAHSGS